MRSALAVVALTGVTLAPPPPSNPSGKKGDDVPNLTFVYGAEDTRPPRRPFAFLEPTDPADYFRAPFQPKNDESQLAPLAGEYRTLFPSVRMTTGLFWCLHAIDPKGLAAFRKFADESLEPRFLKDCEDW